MKSSSQKREHIIIVPGGLLAAKVTNGFRSIWGAGIHALIRSVIGTGRLNGFSAHQAIAGSLTGQKIFDA